MFRSLQQRAYLTSYPNQIARFLATVSSANGVQSELTKASSARPAHKYMPSAVPESGASNANASPSPTPAMSSMEIQWCELSGFSRYSSRFDVTKTVTHPNLIVHELHREVDLQMYPTGKWLVKVEIDTKPKGITNGKAPLDILRPQFMEHFSNGQRVHIKPIPSPTQLRKYVLAKDRNIDDCTLRLHGANYLTGIEHLKFFFEDFELSLEEKSLQRLKMPDPIKGSPVGGSDSAGNKPGYGKQQVTFSWLIRFRTPAEAERAFHTLDNSDLNGSVISFFRYT